MDASAASVTPPDAARRATSSRAAALASFSPTTRRDDSRISLPSHARSRRRDAHSARLAGRERDRRGSRACPRGDREIPRRTSSTGYWSRAASLAAATTFLGVPGVSASPSAKARQRCCCRFPRRVACRRRGSESVRGDWSAAIRTAGAVSGEGGVSREARARSSR